MVDLHQLEQHLTELPTKIRNQALVVLEKENILKKAELEFDVCFGMTLTGSKASSATDRKAMAAIGSRMEAEKVIEAEYNLKKEEIGLKFLENRFTSFRKIGSIETELLRTQINN